ncbi:MAG: PIN domain-containing protein [Candidatus Eremiobacteraeota bacterium]|nr:PIN domain-containing protein [Candidatus Eremiobacteraeota bacterium]MBC5804490.1 PIN domain-containing protein [Candidatus Eremiobacteraeota bacterium]MBC5821314.1 PIN domain-containing protein [Candidatus Eremiobacteraeota bacterium]
MTAPVFVDTNVLIYALGQADLGKQRAARTWRTELWTSRLGRISYQVLQEFYVNVAAKWPSARDRARAEIRDLTTWKPVAIDANLLEMAWNVQDRYRISFWDSAIVAAAKLSSCAYLLTEDLQADQNMGGVVVINPFERLPADLV